MKKILKTLFNFLLISIIVIEFIVIGVVVYNKSTGKLPTVFGYNLYVIVTPSMEPEIKVGDVIIAKEYTGEDLYVGQVITYLGKEGDFTGKMVTHQIIAVNQTEQGVTITTQGIANPAPDPAITKSDVVSVMVRKTVIIGFIYGLISSTWGFVLFIMLPLVLLIVSELIHLAKIMHEQKETEE